MMNGLRTKFREVGGSDTGNWRKGSIHIWGQFVFELDNDGITKVNPVLGI